MKWLPPIVTLCRANTLYLAGFFAVMMSVVSFQNAYASDEFLASSANEASWRYVREAIGNCSDYATTIPKAQPDHPIIQTRVQHTLMDGKCKFTLIMSNSITACFFSPEQRQEIQGAGGTKVIGRLLDDEYTCGEKAEQQVLANITATTPVIQRLPLKEPLIAPAAGISENKPESLADRIKAKLGVTTDVIKPADTSKIAVIKE